MSTSYSFSPAISKKALIRVLWSLVGFLALSTFTFVQAKFYLFPGFRDILDLGDGFHVQHISLMWVPIVGYLLISGTMLLVANVFMKLRPLGEPGLVTFFAISFLLSFFLCFLFYFSAASGFSGFVLMMGFLIGHAGGLCQVYR